MKDSSSSPPQVSAASLPQGIPGLYARSRGFSTSLAPLIAMVFLAGMVFGSIFRPAFLQGWKAGVLLMLIAMGLLITWKRAVLIFLRHEEGARGEEQVARILESLPQGWQVYHEVESAGKRMDHVLVGPAQVFCIETVHWKGQVRVINGKLMHGDQFYPGYDVATLKSRGGQLAESLGVPAGAVAPMVCIVGGRYGDRPGVKDGLWLGEIQDLGTYLLGGKAQGLSAADREKVIGALCQKVEGRTR